jgi:EAL domain-containing protein (putative c-di-GMP-specific phosphodiesterase class I)
MSASRPDGWTTAELAHAVERGQLELHYQPIVDLRSGRIAGAEALLRWRHPSLGLLSPGAFLPQAESSGLMPEVGKWALGEACCQMQRWLALNWWPFRLAVNVSASQVAPQFGEQVKQALADAGLPADHLEIELTESVAFGDPAIFPVFDALRAVGVRFAADDFGTGYSCLQHLKCCPITTLKIDQSFVAGLAADARDRTIVRAVIQLAHGLGMDVVAEGVETPASLALLRDAGCDAVQGFLFAKAGVCLRRLRHAMEGDHHERNRSSRRRLLRVLQGNSARCRLHPGRRGIRRALLRAGVLSALPGARQGRGRSRSGTAYWRHRYVRLKGVRPSCDATAVGARRAPTF